MSMLPSCDRLTSALSASVKILLGVASFPTMNGYLLKKVSYKSDDNTLSE